jgi:UDP-2,3-diacylglucosamine pyrophosphatase LpxH
MLVVSDLHLCAGRDPTTGRYDPRENFFADDAFAAFLRYYRPSQQGGGSLLVLNGDVFDFIRIIDRPETRSDFDEWLTLLGEYGYEPQPSFRLDVESLESRIGRKESSYGLRTDDYKTAWKVRRIAQGHPSFFEALGRWVADGGNIVFVKGNHDLELHWPLIQRAIRVELSRTNPDAPVETNVRFVEHAVKVDNVYIEHGHRFEAMTRVEGPDPTLPSGTELRLPFGSFINRYVINKLEALDPFLDNVKPQWDLVWAIVRRHPLKVFRIFYQGLRCLRPTFLRYMWQHVVAFLGFLASIVMPVLTLLLVLAVILLPGVRDFVFGMIENPWLRRGLGVLGFISPWILHTAQKTFSRKPGNYEDHYAEGIARALQSLEPAAIRMYGVAGHTHAMDVQNLEVPEEIGGGATSRSFQAIYVNSGSWSPRWAQNRPDLLGKVEYSFIEFTRDDETHEYTHHSLEWRDDRGEPVLATLIRRT